MKNVNEKNQYQTHSLIGGSRYIKRKEHTHKYF